MKKTLLTIAAVIAFSVFSFAQTPEKIQYQAVARNASGNIIANQLVGFKISILQGSSSGNSVYTETHIGLTNGYGLVNLQIGNGTVVSGTVASIDWSSNTYFVKIEMDATGGSNYQLMGTSELLSVPYALNAKSADNVFSGDYNDLTNQPTILTSADDADADATNEIQNLTLNGSVLTLSNGGGAVTLPSGGGSNLSSYTNDVGFITSPNDADSDAANEIQNLTLSGTVLTLSNGGGSVTLPSGGSSGIVVIDNSNYTSVTTTDDDIINVKGTINITANYNKFSYSGLSISGGEFIGTGTEKIDFDDISVIKGVTFENLTIGASEQTVFIGCSFTNVSEFGFNATFSGCYFHNCTVGSSGSLGYITNSEVTNCTFNRVLDVTGSKIRDSKFGGDYTTNSPLYAVGNIIGNRIDDSEIHSKYGNFSGNNCDDFALYLYVGGKVAVTGNTFDDVLTTNGLNSHVIVNMAGSALTNLSISDNVFFDNGASPYISLTGSFTGSYNLVKVSGNSFVRGSSAIGNSTSNVRLVVSENALRSVSLGVSNGGTTIVRDNDSL